MSTLSIDFCGVPFANPFTVAASPSSDSRDKVERAFEAGWGGVVFKTVATSAHKPVLAQPNMAGLPYAGKTQSAFYNIDLISERSIGQIQEDIVYFKRKYPDRRLIGSIMASGAEEWRLLVQRLEEAGADLIECSMSCPQGDRDSKDANKAGAIPAADRDLMESTTRIIKGFTSKRTPIIVKLTPNVTDIVDVARGAVAGGADAVCAIDTVRSFIGIDVETGKPKLNVDSFSTWGGLSGPTIKPIALGCVSRIAKALPVSIAGVGGIGCWQDAAEFLLLGAQNVQVCTAISKYGFHMVRAMENGLQDYLLRKGYSRLEDMVGGSLPYLTEYSRLNVEKRVVCRIDESVCQRCGCCVTACQDAGYGALTQAAREYPALNAALCRGCGVCRSVCPKECIDFE